MRKVVTPVTSDTGHHASGESKLEALNRLVLLVGVFLAVVAFVGILLLVRSPQGDVVEQVPTTGPVVVASVDIPLSSRIREDQVTTTVIALDAISPGAFKDPSQVIGQVVRQAVGKGAQITPAVIGATTSGTVNIISTPVGLRSIAVQVDQLTGVGTAIKTGDFVDVIVGLTSRSSRSSTRTGSPSYRRQQHQREGPHPGASGDLHAAAAGTHRPSQRAGVAGTGPRSP